MKIGFISDTHFKLYKKNNSFLHHVTSAVRDFKVHCDQRGVGAVFVLGDVFHLKDTVSVHAQHEALKVLREVMYSYPTYVIPGNHDTLSKFDASVNGLTVFKDCCTLYNDYGTYETDDTLYHFLPYYPDDVVREKLRNVVPHNNKKNVLCTHLGLRGFDLDNGHEDVYSELTVESVGQNFHRVFSGHYHSYQTRRNVTYVSSPFESHYGDSGLHGFTFYDSTTDAVEFVENSNSPRFVHVELNSNTLAEVSALRGCFIKLTLKKNVDTNTLLKYKEKLLKNNYEVQFEWDLTNVSSKLAVAKEWSNTVSTDPASLLRSYVNENDFPFSKKQLLNYLGVPFEDSTV